MKQIENWLLDLEGDLEKKARKQLAEDNRLAYCRLIGYLDGLQDMRIEMANAFREVEKNAVQEPKEECKEQKTDLIREIVCMHEKINAILDLLKKTDFIGGKEEVREIFKT